MRSYSRLMRMRDGSALSLPIPLSSPVSSLTSASLWPRSAIIAIHRWESCRTTLWQHSARRSEKSNRTTLRATSANCQCERILACGCQHSRGRLRPIDGSSAHPSRPRDGLRLAPAAQRRPDPWRHRELKPHTRAVAPRDPASAFQQF